MKITKHTRAVLYALIVTILWSTSWILIKISLQDIPPLTFAGLRYMLAALVLLPVLFRYKVQIRTFSNKDWIRLVLLGLVFYTINQGGSFLALKLLDAVTLSLLFNFSAVIVAIISLFLRKEIPSALQWAGIATFIAGVFVYFLPSFGLRGNLWGYAIAGVTVLANAAASLMGRSINQEKLAHPIVVTGISMGIGAVVMLGIGLAVEEFPSLTLANLAVILWLGVVNTAFAFSLWNRSLQNLSAVESSLINNTMLIQIAILAWIFLDERLTWMDVLGLILAAVGILLAHIQPRRNRITPDLL